jgi:hypothetical protein
MMMKVSWSTDWAVKVQSQMAEKVVLVHLDIMTELEINADKTKYMNIALYDQQHQGRNIKMC